MLFVRSLLILASTKILDTLLNIRPLVEPLVTPQTIKLQPIRELSKLCAHKVYEKKKSVSSRDRDSTFVDIQIVWESTR